jgi:hypothetical protein
VGPQRLVDVVEKGHVRRIVQAARLQPMRQHLLGFRHPAFGQRDGLVLLVHQVVAGGFERLSFFRLGVAACHRALLEPRDDAIDFVVQVRRFFRRT